MNIYRKSRRSGPLPSLRTWGRFPCRVGAGAPWAWGHPCLPVHSPPGTLSLPAQKPPPRLPRTCALSSSAIVAGPCRAGVTADPRRRAGVPVGGVPRTLQSRDLCPACSLQPCTTLTLSRWPALPGAEGGCLGSPCGPSFCSVAPGRLQRGKPCHLGCGGPCGVLGQTPG